MTDNALDSRVWNGAAVSTELCGSDAHNLWEELVWGPLNFAPFVMTGDGMGGEEDIEVKWTLFGQGCPQSGGQEGGVKSW